MENYYGIPVYDMSEIAEGFRRDITNFDNMAIVVPPRAKYAFVREGEGFIGVWLSRNGQKGFKQEPKEAIFTRTCPTFIGRMMSRPGEFIEAKLAS